MAKRISAYQKLKAENAKLKNEIRILSSEDKTSMEYMAIVARYNFKEILDKAMFFGTVVENTKSQGVYPLIKDL